MIPSRVLLPSRLMDGITSGTPARRRRKEGEMADVTRFLLWLWSTTATSATAPAMGIGTNASRRTRLPSRLRMEAFVEPPTARVRRRIGTAGGRMECRSGRGVAGARARSRELRGTAGRMGEGPPRRSCTFRARITSCTPCPLALMHQVIAAYLTMLGPGSRTRPRTVHTGHVMHESAPFSSSCPLAVPTGTIGQCQLVDDPGGGTVRV